jgi:hypothetical protein
MRQYAPLHTFVEFVLRYCKNIKRQFIRPALTLHLTTGTRWSRGRVEAYLYSLINLGAGWVDGPRHAPAALPPVKTRYRLYRRLSVPQSQSGQVRKISPPPGFDPRTVQPVASSYTD